MTIPAATSLVRRIAKLGKPVGLLVVLIPDFRFLRTKAKNTWMALEDLYSASASLAEYLDHDVSRDQGKLVVWVESSDELRDLIAATRCWASRSASWPYTSSLRAGVANLNSVARTWNTATVEEAMFLGHYLAHQVGRWQTSSVMKRWPEAGELNTHFDGLRSSRSLSTRQSIVKSLYAIPLGGSTAVRPVDELELWFRHTRVWPTSGCAVLTDIHWTEKALARDLHDIAEDYLGHKADYSQTMLHSIRVRQAHNAMLDGYFDVLRAGNPMLFRASGDGLIGFVDDPRSVVDANVMASKSISERLSSGVAVAPIHEDHALTMGEVEIAMHITKLMKDSGCELSSSYVFGESIPNPSRRELRNRLMNASSLSSESAIFKDLLKIASKN